MKANGFVTVEIARPNKNSVSRLPCYVAVDKIYTLTRAYCRESLQQLSGIHGENKARILSYELNG